jgi:hypothetical protein
MNPKLAALVAEWKADGSPAQEKFDWSVSRKNWVKSFPNHSGFINLLPGEIDRSYVRGVCDSNQYAIIEKFLSVMVWGYGDRGYGPYRVTQMLNQPHTESTLSEVFNLAKSGKPIEAYEFLKDNRIRILGPSYGTKFISFCTPRNIGAPIYDSYIALWVSKFAASEFSEVPVSSENWNVKTYSRYWSWVKSHAENLECYPDEIELTLFRDAEREFSKNSSWMGK